MKNYVEAFIDSWNEFSHSFGFKTSPNDFFYTIGLLSKIVEEEDEPIYPRLILPKCFDFILDATFSTKQICSDKLCFGDLRRRARVKKICIQNNDWNNIPNVLASLKKSDPIRKKYGTKFFEQRDIIDKNIDILLRSWLWEQISTEDECDEIIFQKDGIKRGRMEDSFFEALMKQHHKYIRINRKVGNFFPDIVIQVRDNKCIDVEIDEPYEFTNKEEIHFIGCGDEKRNEYFQNQGWFVLRFSEINLVKYFDECVLIVENLVKFLRFNKPKYLEKLLSLKERIEHTQWTFEEAHFMALKNYRKKWNK